MRHHDQILRSFLAGCAFLFAASSFAAKAPDPSGQPAEITTVVATQIEITHSAVDQLLRKLNESSRRSQENTFHIQDYRQAAPLFQAEIESGLIRFETAMRESILKRYADAAAHYNAVVLSKSLASEQKTIILAKQLGEIKLKLIDIERDYQSEIMKLYQLAGDLPYDLQMKKYELKNAQSRFKKILANEPGSGFIYLLTPVTLQRGLADQKSLSREDFARLASYLRLFFQFNIDPALLSIPLRSNRISAATSFRWFDEMPLDTLTRISGKLTTADFHLDTASGTNAVLFFDSDLERAEVSDLDGFSPAANRVIRSAKMKALAALFTDAKIVKQTTSDESETYYEFARHAQKYYPTLVYPILRQHCRSQLCLGLRAADLDLFLLTTKLTLDRAVQFQLADGTKLKIEGTRFNPFVASGFLSQTNYPDELPFDTE